MATLSDLLSFSRSSDGSYFDSSGILQIASTDQKRINYNPTDLSKNGLLIEPGATNIFSYSDDFMNSVWANTETKESGHVAPNGLNEAVKITRTNVTIWARSFIASSTECCCSIFIKGITNISWAFLVRNNTTSTNLGAILFNPITGALTPPTPSDNYGVQALPNGWWRVWISQKTGINSGNNISFYYGVTSGTSGIGNECILWGADATEIAELTSHIKTTTTGASRAADVLYLDDLVWYNNVEGTFVLEYKASMNFGKRKLAAYSLNNGTVNSRIVFFDDSSTSNADNVPKMIVTNGGNENSASLSLTNLSRKNVHKNASYVTGSLIRSSVDGSSVVVATNTASLPSSGLTRLDLGSEVNSDFLTGHLRKIKYFPKLLSDEELIAESTL